MLSEAKNKDSGYVTGEEEDLVFRIRMYWTEGVSPVEIYGNMFWLHV